MGNSLQAFIKGAGSLSFSFECINAVTKVMNIYNIHNLSPNWYSNFIWRLWIPALYILKHEHKPCCCLVLFCVSMENK